MFVKKWIDFIKNYAFFIMISWFLYDMIIVNAGNVWLAGVFGIALF